LFDAEILSLLQQINVFYKITSKVERM